MNTHAVFAEKVLAVTPSTVLDAHIGYTRNVVVQLAVQNQTLITVVADAKVLPVQLTGDLIMNGFLCKIKNWMLLIHSATLEIRSVLGVVAI